MEVSASRLDAARYKIEELLAQIRDGKVRVPRFQRPLRWTGKDVERLFDSIYKGYPVGTLLFWVREAEAEAVALGPVTIDAPALQEANWVVDGQQRLTALAASLLPNEAHSEDLRFEITFDLETETFSTSRPDDPDTRLPVREAFDLQRVLSWLRERALSDEAQDRAFRLADRLRNYEMPAYLVRADSEAALQEIFDRTNTFGKSMTKAEVFHALHTSATKPELDLDVLRTEIEEVGFGALVGNTLLYSVLASRGPDVLRDFRSEFKSDEDQISAFRETKSTLLRVIEFLRDEADVPHFSLIPYQHQTVGLVRFFALHPNASSSNKVLLRRWFWQAAELGPIARLGNTGTLRATAGAVTPEGEYESIEALLRLSEGSPPDYDSGVYRWTSAETRISVCALASLKPRRVSGGDRIDVTRIVDLAGREALQPLLATSHELGKSIANRVFSEPDERLGQSEVVDALLGSSSEVLDSHCLRSRDVRMLEAGQEASVLEDRGQRIKALTAQFVSARAERDLPVRRTIGELLHGAG